MTTSTPAATAPQTPEEAYAYYRSRRHEMALLPQGSLALVNTQWFYGAPGETESIWGVNGLWSALPEGEKGIQLTASAAENITVDGVVVDGTVVVTGKDAETASTIVF
ncbi:MAG: DUF1684 domain-containing protein, partial [Aurantimicrobium sp.]